jgi:hypothetical protein
MENIHDVTRVNPRAVTQTKSMGKDRRIYTWAAIGGALLIVIGFSRTYYLKQIFGTPSLTAIVHFHGLIMTAWIALFIVQVRLVAVRRTNWHRRLGFLGCALAILIVLVQYKISIAFAMRGVSSPNFPPPQVFLLMLLGESFVFIVLVGLGLYFRRRPEIHKRLFLLSWGGVLPAGIARLPIGFIESGGLPVAFALTDLFLLGALVFDTVKHRRLHPAFWWGWLFVVLVQIVRFPLADSHVWLRLAAWLTS